MLKRKKRKWEKRSRIAFTKLSIGYTAPNLIEKNEMVQLSYGTSTLFLLLRLITSLRFSRAIVGMLL